MIEIEEGPDRIVLKPDFDIVASRVAEVRDTVLKNATPGKMVILDFSEVTLIDSMGIGVVVACLKTLRELGGDLKVDTDNQEVIGLFKLLKLDDILTTG